VGESENKEKRVGRNFRLALCLGLSLGMVAAPVLADAQWRITSPYPGNPLKVAVLSGEGRASGSSFPVSLEFACHPGAAVPRVTLRVPLLVADWDFSAFAHAPSGDAPLRRRDLVVFASNRRIIGQPNYTGIAADSASFTFIWQPDEALLSRLTHGNDGIQIHLRGIRRSQGRLETRFIFPSDSGAMRAALGPCSRSLPAVAHSAASAVGNGG
jgi:hypothetical protein